MGGGDEFRFHRGIDTEETGVGYGGRTDSNVNPLGSGPSDHLDDLSARGGPHDGVVDYHNSPPPNELLHRV